MGSGARSSGAQRLELVRAAVGHESEKEMTVLDQEGPDTAPLFDDLIVQRSGGALRAREGERTELELIGTTRCPGAASAVAVDAGGQPSIGFKCDRVLG